MTREFLETLKCRYLAYADTFRENGELPLMMRVARSTIQMLIVNGRKRHKCSR